MFSLFSKYGNSVSTLGVEEVADSDLQQMHHMFNEVRPVRGFDDIALQIQKAIVDGRLKAGDRLPNERDLGAIFGVSRPTLREAIRSLEAAGVVEVRRGTNGGTFISEPKADQVGQALATLIRFRRATADELAEFRANFETETAYWAAKRATQNQIDRLLEISNQFKEAISRTDTSWSQVVDLDLAFHEEVAHASQNQIRVAIMLAIHEVMRKSALLIGNMEDMKWRIEQADDLRAIANAIGKHQVRVARRLMKEHVLRNIQAVAKQKSSELESSDWNENLGDQTEIF